MTKHPHIRNLIHGVYEFAFDGSQFSTGELALYYGVKDDIHYTEMK
jgi:hypothetical protein